MVRAFLTSAFTAALLALGGCGDDRKIDCTSACVSIWGICEATYGDSESDCVQRCRRENWPYRLKLCHTDHCGAAVETCLVDGMTGASY